MKKRIISLLLVVMVLFSLAPTAFAANDEATEAADKLHALGLFNGTGTGADGKPIYDLDRAPTRHEAVTMLVRLLGKEAEALAGTWETPFTDVAEWAKPYVGYAYANGLTSGTSATTYSGNDTVTASQYITFVLRALGYDSSTDFQWNKAWELSDKIGLTDGRYNAKTTKFLRGDVVIISYNSLSCERKTNIFEDIPEETAVQKSNYDTMMRYWDKKYRIPESSKGLTLTWDMARALVGQDIETVKRYVKTLEDCLYYFCASDFSLDTSGSLAYADGAVEWQFNRTPQIVFEQNKGNCGGIAGLVAYLLEGDYDEVGYVGLLGMIGDGGHEANYLKNGTEYYVFDINQFVGGYEKGLNFSASPDLNAAVINSFGYDKNHPKVMMHTYTGCFDGDAPIGGGTTIPEGYIIDGYVDHVNIVMEMPEDGYVYKFIDVSQETLDKIEEIRNRK